MLEKRFLIVNNEEKENSAKMPCKLKSKFFIGLTKNIFISIMI